MDADTRHQLKQNELAEALSKLVSFSDKRTLAWLVVILVVALAYAGYKLWSWRQHTHLIDAQQTLAQINAIDTSLGEAPLEQLRRLIADSSQPGLLALARLRLAEGLEARGKLADGSAKLAEAEAEYNSLLRMPGAPGTIKAAALYRLGIICENKRDFAGAREMYTTLSRNPSYRGSPFVTVAEARLKQLDELAVPVAFEPGMNPAPPPAPVPASTTQPMLRPVPIIDQSGESLPLPISRAPTSQPHSAAEPAPPPAPGPDQEEAPADQPAAEPTEPEQP
jgi:hypothetical protein